MTKGVFQSKENDRFIQSHQIWKKINIGTIKSSKNFFESLTKNKIELEYYVELLLETNFDVSPKKQLVKLVLKSVSDLGFKKGAAGIKILNRAINLGYDLCSYEIGPQLRLQYLDQPKGEKLYIGMHPVKNLCKSSLIYSLAHSDAPFHDFNNRASLKLVTLNEIFLPRQLFVFCVP